MKLDQSLALQRRAESVIPGGVDSPVRSFRAVPAPPRWIASGDGAWIFDVDGNRYLDYIGSWGALLLGHAHPDVVAAVRRAAGDGASFGLSAPAELALAEAVRVAFPAAERLRFVNSGTEAVMSALRLARGFTGRDKIVKFIGCYHGHTDAMLVAAGSGVATLGIPGSAGVPAAAAAPDTLPLPYNDAAALESAFARWPNEIAAVIVEPVAGNMGCVPPQPGWLERLHELTRAHGALLIADEVMTGFRVAWGGACERFGLQPDLVTLGKIVGGGLPVAAFGGRADILQCIAPLGPVYQAGTLAGNPLAMAAGLACLQALDAARRPLPGLYEQLEARGTRLAEGLRQTAAAAGVAVCVQQVGAMLTVFFAPGPIRDFAAAERCDTAAFGRFHAAMLERGVLFPPSQFEAAFLSCCHGDAEVELTLEIARAAFAAAANRESGTATGN